MKRKIALFLAAVAVAGVATSGALAAQPPKNSAPAGWEQTAQDNQPGHGQGQAQANAKPQVGPGGSSTNPGPQQIWKLILNFLRSLLHHLFPWFA